jgi:hypothetical protein
LKDKWRNLLDPRSNSKTPIHFKQLAKQVKENLIQNQSRIKGIYRSVVFDWKNAFQQLEMNENEDEQIKKKTENNFSFCFEQEENWNLEQFNFEDDDNF